MDRPENPGVDPVVSGLQAPETVEDKGKSPLQILATRIRINTLKMVYRARSSHIGGCFSIAELLAVLYGRVLRVNPADPDWAERDRFILSKGHAAAALYAVLAERGFIPQDILESFYQNGSPLIGHVTHTRIPGVEVSTGSLGHGLSLGCGMALGGKRQKCSYRVFVLLSDGECDEGATWEAALFAGHHHLDNLVAIVDYNKIQSLGRVEEVLNLEPLVEKWRSFGWEVKEGDGHDVHSLVNALETVPWHPSKPSCFIAHTVKGKGVSFMEDRLLWHYRSPDQKEYEQALKELERML